MKWPKQSHKRLNLLTDEWVLVSPQRTNRPWQGKTEKKERREIPRYVSNCYLCPGNMRAASKQNPQYDSTYVFDNDFPALEHVPVSVPETHSLLQSKSESGICRVICYSPDHSLTMAEMTEQEIILIIQEWQHQYIELGNKEHIHYVQIFENKGALMGCSNPHPHGQIWAQESLPNEIVKKENTQLKYYLKKKKSLLTDYYKEEIKEDERIIYQNDHFIVLIPFWAIWPFETMIIPKEHQSSIAAMSREQINHFSNALSKLTKAYNALFDTSFPYSCGIHQAPTNEKQNKHWHWHMIFYPPLLRSASIKKFMVGYEMFGMPQRDITPEWAAKKLRTHI